jgi:glucokinase
VRVLAGDIGGTKTAIAIIETGLRRSRVLRLERYSSAAYAALEDILADFLSSEKVRPAAAGFGVAGPVANGKSKITNLPWRLDERSLSRRFGIRHATLVNDFGANALGLRFLAGRQLATLARGREDAASPIVILGAGTGLGQAAVLRTGGHDVVVFAEAGHVDYGARSPLEDRLVAFLRGRFGRATRERILSGSGLALLYEFLAEDGCARRAKAPTAALAGGEDPAAVISRFGLARRDPLCRAALDLFVSIYGSEAGNAALAYRATGGVFLAGGIAPKILPALKRPEFLRAFHDKAPMNALLRDVPVRVVLDPSLGLYGAAAAGAYRTTIETTRPS